MHVLKKVLVLYAGGTIGMKRNHQGVLVPIPNTFLRKVKSSELHDPKIARKYMRELKDNELIIPKDNEEGILYEIIEYNPLLDSSDMTCKDWIKIAKDIEVNYDNFDGFVVLHGTDTLAYTSSALSFMLEGLHKPVIVTGSQIPIFEQRSDAKSNFLLSLIIAGSYKIPEVCVFFANKLYRGNRITKVHSCDLNAFDSPNFSPLAEVGIDIKVHHQCVENPTNLCDKFRVHSSLNQNVAVLSFFPTITSQMLKAFLSPPVKGVIIQSYGTGNLPSKRKDLLELLGEAIKNNILIVNVTQCSKGTICSSYETGKVLEELGIVSGEDMTVEAALTKLILILGIPGLTFEQRVKEMKRNWRGEISREK